MTSVSDHRIIALATIVSAVLLLLPVCGVQWETVSAIALVLTLGIVAVYTKASHDMATFQSREIGLHRKPIITVQYRTLDAPDVVEDREFWTSIKNLSSVHARARIRASIILRRSGEWVELWRHHERGIDYFYSGSREWAMQARSEFRGNLSLPEILQRMSENDPTPDLAGSWIRIETWAINHEDTWDGLENNAPPTEPILYWIRRNRRWEPEPGFLFSDVQTEGVSSG
jgi:hypothetical protein